MSIQKRVVLLTGFNQQGKHSQLLGTCIQIHSKKIETEYIFNCFSTVIAFFYIDRIEQKKKIEKENKNLKVAVMGCAVNGPGEAKEADIGIAGGKGYGLIFKKGEILKKVPEDMLIPELLKLINEL